ncbi:hypothetical protein PCASD_22165 [Puccinia coronata f. sp. avenae]|uniref:Uncharacterized protein n=1 Tax=Puccinia coronata f. sp. avenae TaxID=200324 RepID=A0A2N5U2R3_9BASI|nr:hypothetical protein PCASD_22165 [Puccinia coronata f. sp. avenae]
MPTPNFCPASVAGPLHTGSYPGKVQTPLSASTSNPPSPSSSRSLTTTSARPLPPSASNDAKDQPEAFGSTPRLPELPMPIALLLDIQPATKTKRHPHCHHHSVILQALNQGCGWRRLLPPTWPWGGCLRNWTTCLIVQRPQLRHRAFSGPVKGAHPTLASFFTHSCD